MSPPTLVTAMQELQRILADKELKEALTTGVQLFNTNAVKGAPAAYRRVAEMHHYLASRPRRRRLVVQYAVPPKRSSAAMWTSSSRAGLRALVRNGVIPDGSPATAAAFLREHAQRLDKGQVGELFGHHDDHSIAVS